MSPPISARKKWQASTPMSPSSLPCATLRSTTIFLCSARRCAALPYSFVVEPLRLHHLPGELADHDGLQPQRVAQPGGTLVSRVRRHPVDRPDLLLHLARRPVERRGAGRRQRESGSAGVDGSQRRLLCGGEAEGPGTAAAETALVSVGGGADLD